MATEKIFGILRNVPKRYRILVLLVVVGGIITGISSLVKKPESTNSTFTSPDILDSEDFLSFNLGKDQSYSLCFTQELPAYRYKLVIYLKNSDASTYDPFELRETLPKKGFQPNAKGGCYQIKPSLENDEPNPKNYTQREFWDKWVTPSNVKSINLVVWPPFKSLPKEYPASFEAIFKASRNYSN